jgi:hypothetical protein
MKTSTRQILHHPARLLRLAGGLGLLTLVGLPTPSLRASPLIADIGVSIHIDDGPPAPRHEVIVERDRPGPDFVWVGGFWDGSPGHYVWRAGHWDRPPHGHEHGQWIAPHWEKDHDGHYHQIKGEWR